MSTALLTDKEVRPFYGFDMNSLFQYNDYYPESLSSCCTWFVPVSSTIRSDDSSSLSDVSVDEFSDRSKEILGKLLDMTKLGDDWDSYGSPPPSPEFVKILITVLSKTGILEIPGIDAFPLSGGGIQIEWSNGAQEVEISFFHNGKVTYLVSGEVEMEGSFDLPSAISKLRSIKLRTAA